MLIKTLILIFFIEVYIPITAQESYPVHTMNFTSQNQSLQMSYLYEKSPGGKGQTILLLHGKNFSASYWNATITSLLSKGYDVVAPEQVGFGRSSKPMQYQYSFQQLAVNTRILIDTLGIKRPIILGHSMGGMLAIRFALLYPDCAQLILEDPLGLEDWKLYLPYATVDMEYKKEQAKTKEALKKYMQENYFHNEWKPAYESLLTESSKNLSDKKFSWSMALTSDMIFTQPVCYEFTKLTVPTALIIGELDRTAPGKEKADKETAAMLGDYPKLGKEAAGKIPNCKLIILEGLGHIPHIENFSLFINTLDDILIKKQER